MDLNENLALSILGAYSVCVSEGITGLSDEELTDEVRLEERKLLLEIKKEFPKLAEQFGWALDILLR